MAAAAVLLASCTAAATGPGAAASDPVAAASANTVRTPRPDHVIVVVFENKARSQILGHAPYLTELADRSALLTGSHALTHPSQPNYYALFSGSTQGIIDDSCVRPLHGRANLGQQLTAAGLRFTAYSEGLPAAGYRGCHTGRYAAKHNPWVAFDNVPASANQPYTAWPRNYNQLPTVGFLIPDLCHDMHDCSVADGDRWARAHLDPYARWATNHNSLLIVTFDENDGRPGNRIFTLITGAHVHPGHYPAPVDHYGLLRTIESFYRLPLLGKTKRSPAVTASIWR